MINLASVSEKDYSALKQITCVCLDLMLEIPPEEKSRLEESILENLQNNIGVSTNTFLKADDDGLVVGFILIKGYKKLSELFVRPEYQNQGIGALLLKKALKASNPDGCNEYVWVNAALNAVPFYKKHGFIEYKNNDKQFNFVEQLQYRF